MISKQKRQREAEILRNLFDTMGMPVHYTQRQRLITNFPFLSRGMYYVVNDEVYVTNTAMMNASVYCIHYTEWLDHQVLTSLLASELSEEELEKVIVAAIGTIMALPATIAVIRSLNFYTQVLASITGLTIYERIVSGESIRVKIKCPIAKQRKKPFMVYPLHLMDNMHYVTKSSKWFRWSHVGGIRIGNNKHALSEAEMIEWCDRVEEVKQ
jgi:hypothetical protein